MNMDEISLLISGILGKRTKFQQKDISQLVLHVQQLVVTKKLRWWNVDMRRNILWWKWIINYCPRSDTQLSLCH